MVVTDRDEFYVDRLAQFGVCKLFTLGFVFCGFDWSGIVDIPSGGFAADVVGVGREERIGAVIISGGGKPGGIAGAAIGRYPGGTLRTEPYCLVLYSGFRRYPDHDFGRTLVQGIAFAV